MPGDVVLDTSSCSDSGLTKLWHVAVLCGSNLESFWWEVRGQVSRHLALINVAGNFEPDVSFEEFSRVFVPNRLHFVASSQATWNSNGLLTNSPLIYNKKAGHARRLIVRHDITLLQECHGTIASATVLLGDDD